ncbi:hypothetical protein IRT45_09195 [Nocardia sp. BSTN01]|uniref:hypothetical protein n=1 Tax=Nocardia sp. BSTN01 TaxID=2783665 RepID=UPI00188E3D35|nr:hypothetical protein [Nocardia sp. BSTN01]MBF4997332.1 hypothetical protein [Nocardia sp. BSTN01]
MADKTVADDLAGVGDVAGGFGGRAIASGRRLDPRQWTSDEPILGLTREAGYLWGTVRDSENGDIFSVMRRIPPAGVSGIAGTQSSMSNKLVVLSTIGGSGTMDIRREAKGAALSDALSRAAVDNGVRFHAPAGADSRALDLVLTTDSLTYSEEQLADVNGRLAVPGLQWFLTAGGASTLYLTQTWRVSGRLLGRPVDGFLFWEEPFMKPGARLYVDQEPLHEVGYTTWYSWANEYDDGEIEVGHFLFGGNDFHVGVISSSVHGVRSVGSMSAAITRAEDGYWHAGLEYDLDGEAWVAEPDPRGRMQLGPIPNPQQEAQIRRRDETREIRTWMAWGETVPATDTPRAI